ncbi:hypothetical protein [Pasteuria penetrans]|uniref:hypothetical protein n=1 Tax=Pasteuria penetrans TaxID=86005 RepID=UPI000F9E219F|nr:hypothetical protein [Pasteuria penetrans]
MSEHVYQRWIPCRRWQWMNLALILGLCGGMSLWWYLSSHVSSQKNFKRQFSVIQTQGTHTFPRTNPHFIRNAGSPPRERPSTPSLSKKHRIKKLSIRPSHSSPHRSRPRSSHRRSRPLGVA